jgi:hypothetical protein
MKNFDAIRSAGVAITNANGTASLVVSTGPGKLLSLFALSTNQGVVMVQASDTAIANVSGSPWATGPFLQASCSSGNPPGGTEIVFDVPVACENGLVVQISTSGTNFVADASAWSIGCQFVPDPNAVPPGTQN